MFYLVLTFVIGSLGTSSIVVPDRYFGLGKCDAAGVAAREAVNTPDNWAHESVWFTCVPAATN